MIIEEVTENNVVEAVVEEKDKEKTKVCSVCGIEKLESEFRFYVKEQYRYAYCSLCEKARAKEYYQKNIEEHRAKRKEHYLKHREEKKAYYIRTKEAKLLKAKQYAEVEKEIKVESVEKEKTKVCTKCGVEKSEVEFYFDKTKQGRWSICNSCDKVVKHNYYLKNIEKAKLRGKKWRSENAEETRKYQREYRAKVKDEEWYKLKIKQKSKRRYARLKGTEYLNNKRRKDYVVRRCDPQYRLRDSIKHRIYASLLSAKRGRGWESLVGYTREQLKAHLELQFVEGMTWDNYGHSGWVVDHIKPVCSFEFSSFEDQQFKDCWALSNLRPLWEKDNQAKVSSDIKLSVRKKKISIPSGVVQQEETTSQLQDNKVE